jgi:hypothetical protein
MSVLLSISLAAEATDSNINDTSLGTTISGPTEEQALRYASESDLEQTVGAYIKGAVARELKNQRPAKSTRSELDSLKAEVDKLKTYTKQGIEQNHNDLQRYVNILTKFKTDIDSNYLYIKSIQKELGKVGVNIEEHQKNLTATASSLESKLADSKHEFDVLSSQLDGQLNQKLEKSSALESRVESYTYILIITAFVCILSAIGAFLYALLLSRRFGILKTKYEKLENDLNNTRQQQAHAEKIRLMQEREAIEKEKKAKDKEEKEAQNKDTKAIKEIDHSFMLKLAEELMHMENALGVMAKDAQGYDNMQQAIEKIKTDAKAKGYEFISYIGKDYTTDLVCDADFITDESIAEGKSIITTMMRMQVNYNGKMIQKPRFVVKQHLTY